MNYLKKILKAPDLPLFCILYLMLGGVTFLAYSLVKEVTETNIIISEKNCTELVEYFEEN